MTIKKTVPVKLALAKSEYKLPAAFQETGLRSVQRVAGTEIQRLRTTPAGRRVALTFGAVDGKRGTNIYMDEIMTVIQRREFRTYGVVVKKAAAKKKVVAKKAAKKVAFKSSSSGKFLTVEGEMRGSSFVSKRGEAIVERVRETRGETMTFAVKSDNPIIPPSIKKFVLYFFNNLRKLICPRAGTKPSLSTGGQAAITAIAVWIAGALGLAAHVATSLASAALILIATATKGAFCDMTAEMAKAAIKKA
jgi:hypothetical protein